MQDDSEETGPIGAPKSTPILRPAGSSRWYFVGEFIILCCGEIKFHITAGQKSKTGENSARIIFDVVTSPSQLKISSLTLYLP